MYITHLHSYLYVYHQYSLDIFVHGWFQKHTKLYTPIDFPLKKRQPTKPAAEYWMAHVTPIPKQLLIREPFKQIAYHFEPKNFASRCFSFSKGLFRFPVSFQRCNHEISTSSNGQKKHGSFKHHCLSIWGRKSDLFKSTPPSTSKRFILCYNPLKNVQNYRPEINMSPEKGTILKGNVIFHQFSVDMIFFRGVSRISAC